MPKRDILRFELTNGTFWQPKSLHYNHPDSNARMFHQLMPLGPGIFCTRVITRSDITLGHFRTLKPFKKPNKSSEIEKKSICRPSVLDISCRHSVEAVVFIQKKMNFLLESKRCPTKRKENIIECSIGVL